MTRFRRTKDELARGLTPAQAQVERAAFQATLANAVMPTLTAAEAQKEYDAAVPMPLSKKTIDKIVRSVVRKSKGEIVIRIRPNKDVDSDYFEHLRDGEIVVEQDNDFYKWLDHYLSKVYADAGVSKFFTDLLDQGIGSIITNIHLEKDIK